MSDPLSSPASETPLAPAYTDALRTHALTLLARRRLHRIGQLHNGRKVGLVALLHLLLIVAALLATNWCLFRTGSYFDDACKLHCRGNLRRRCCLKHTCQRCSLQTATWFQQTRW